MSSPRVIQLRLAPPPAPDRLVARPRLDRLLTALIERHRVLVVCATAGAGKTTALAEATRPLQGCLAWLSLDATDAAPGRLVTYLEAALARRNSSLAGIATSALAAGIPHAEAVGLLVEAASGQSTVLVLDDLERLGEDPVAWGVINALLRYAPEEMHIVLVSRRELPAAVRSSPVDGALTALGELDLAFTADEAAEALARVGSSNLNAAATVRATGGWVTGVLFEAWRSEDHVAGSGGETDPLYGYLSTQILDQLAPDDREFLVLTSVLDEVTAGRAESLGLRGAGERLASLRSAHLPVSWESGWRAMRCHARFREYLSDRLERRAGPVVHDLTVAHARLLAVEGRDEEATEEFLREAAYEEAAITAGRAIFAVIERLDFAIAERWLKALASTVPTGPNRLTTAELMLSIAQDDYGRALRISDRLAALGVRERLAAISPHAAALMGWCYLHQARIDDTRAVIAPAGPSPDVDVVRYAAWLLVDYAEGERPHLPELTGGPLDALILHTNYFLGRLSEAVVPSSSRWTEALARPHRIAALRALGRTHEALALYESSVWAGVASLPLKTTIGPELLIDAHRPKDAILAVAEGRRLAVASGSLGFRALNVVVAAKLAARLEHDAVTARAALDELERDGIVHCFEQTSERFNMWFGYALLLQTDGEALSRLRGAVGGMVRGDRLLELPTAAVYLAEAEWRTGDADAADRAADQALEAATRQGSNHLLLQALTDFPAVASRRIDAERNVNSAWHQLGRVLMTQGVEVGGASLHAAVQLREFGEAAISIDGVEARPELAKCYELLAFLCTRSSPSADRIDLLDTLFDGRTDDSARSYLRQTIRRLREVLPVDAFVSTARGVHLGSTARIGSDSVQFEMDLAESGRLQGEARRLATVAALAIYDRGAYLPEAKSGWVAERRRHLGELALNARYEVAELAFAAGGIQDARRFCEDTLLVDPYREAAWRLRMRISSALGDEAGVLTAFHRCEQALHELQTQPTGTTRELLELLRR